MVILICAYLIRCIFLRFVLEHILIIFFQSLLRKVMASPRFIAHRDRLRDHLFVRLRLFINNFMHSLGLLFGIISVISDKVFLENFSHDCLLCFVKDLMECAENNT